MKLLLSALVLSFSFSAHAYTIHYFCKNTDNGADQILKINKTRSGKSVSVSRVKGDKYGEGFVFTAKFDPTYKPRGKANLLRFVGEESEHSDFRGKRHAIVSEDLMDEAKKGYFQIRGDEDGYWSQNFTCYLRSVSTK